MGQVTGYNLLGTQIRQHMKDYTAPGFSEPNRVFSNYFPSMFGDRPRELLQNFMAGTLEDYLSEDNDGIVRECEYIKSAILDFFEKGFYKNAVGFETPDSKKYSSIDELQEDISNRNSSVIRIDNCELKSTNKQTYTVEKYDGLSLVARIRKISPDSVDLDFFNQNAYDLAGRPIKDPPLLFAQLKLTDKNIGDYQMEVLKNKDKTDEIERIKEKYKLLGKMVEVIGKDKEEVLKLSKSYDKLSVEHDKSLTELSFDNCEIDCVMSVTVGSKYISEAKKKFSTLDKPE